MNAINYKFILPYFVSLANLSLGLAILKLTFMFFEQTQVDRLNTILLFMSLSSMALSLNFNTFCIAQGAESKDKSYVSFLIYCTIINCGALLAYSVISLPLILAVNFSFFNILILAEANQSFISKKYINYIVFSLLPVLIVMLSMLTAQLFSVEDITIARIVLPLFLQFIIIFSLIQNIDFDLSNFYKMLSFGIKIIPTSFIMFIVSNIIRADEYISNTFTPANIVLALSVLTLFTVIVDTTQKLFMYLIKQGYSKIKLLCISTLLFVLATSIQLFAGLEIYKFIILIITNDLDSYLGALDIIKWATLGITIRLLTIVPNIHLHLNLNTFQLLKVNLISIALTLIFFATFGNVVWCFVSFYVLQGIMFLLLSDWKDIAEPA